MEEQAELTYMPNESAAPTRADMRRSFSRIGLGLCLGLLFSQVLPVIVAAILPNFDTQAHAFLLGGLCTGLFTLPVLALSTRRLLHKKPEGETLTAISFLSLIAICYGVMITGNLIGMGVNSLLSPGSMDLIGTLATEAGLTWETVIAFVVLAPVFEELVFRKVIVDRVLPFGEWPAIVFSGLTFGLFHGNLTQFFYATMLGMTLAYVYIRTGRVLYTIGLHACLNFLGGVLPLWLPAASAVMLGVAVLGVVLFFIGLKKVHVNRNGVPGAGAAMFTNTGMILFILVSGIFMALVAVLMNHPEWSGGLM